MSVWRTRTPWLALAVVTMLAGACSSGRPEPPRSTAQKPEEASARVQPAAPAAPETTQAEPAVPDEEVSGAYGPQTVVIDQPEVEESETQTLVEAARAAREARAREGEPIAVITDETLPEYATGELSVVEEKPGAEPAAPAPTSAAPEAEAEVEERGEAYWRERVRGARMRWRDLVEEIARLEGEVAELRRRFYAEDDGFYRDSQIKPAWDRALDRLAETRHEVDRAQENLTTILEEGRFAGALPGWLREGIEYEPPAEETDQGPGIHEATEPPVIEDDDGEIDDGR